ncbi:hypothetical protein [Sphingomonas sp. OK281]|uniref:hypothetical protein n=1 Tax=Sphingomonas sp. OK281 TaxID=1881067 RepID=UPI0008E8527A|nr:hypothetical protein [Sphingomonas sp. OK281]SFO02041.1 hypothetical protein SAMN05428984_1662 [Sphingomonas sp. OK281]
MSRATTRDGIVTHARTVIDTLEPWYDWGKIGVERMESLRPGKTATDGEVRFFELQWLGIHIAFQIGRTPKGASQHGNPT